MPPAGFRTDVSASGNRLFDGSIDLGVGPVAVELGDEPVWVVATGDGSWLVTLEGGGAVIVDGSGEVTPGDAPADGAPPIVRPDGQVVSAHDELAAFDAPLPAGRVVHADRWSAALVSPTDRYAHAVLGDAIEAGAVEVLDRCSGDVTRIEVPPPEVIEGVSPMLVDLDSDGVVEVVVTTANDEVGARLEAYRLDGTLLAVSDPVGRGRRWRNQLGAAPLGPEGAIELVDVQTPHLGGIVRFSRVEGGALVRQASLREFTSHVIGSRNLDLGILADTTGDGQPEVQIYSQERARLVAIERTGDGAEVVAEVALGDRGVTNLAVQQTDVGGALALGTVSGSLLIWGP